ncbi:VTC domain-containing protein [Candidatus Peregrinibacteria bacterium]|nr:VTC domain-containing protein [Candidatus Peregrinibacteria bacterium]MBI2524186.1 VTC domain-containing protein [Candidatus Peregrinibacteria bacterium]
MMRLRRPSAQPPLHFRRMEVKYLLPDRLVPAFLERIAPYTEVDPFLVAKGQGQTQYPVASLYFDSADLHALAEKDAGLLSRRKLRLRTYAEEFSERAPCFLEIKRRHDFVVSKDRLALSVGRISHSPTEDLLSHLLHRIEAEANVTTEANLLHRWYNLQPMALVRYRRIPLVARHDRRFRVTVDRDLAGFWRPAQFLGPIPLHQCLLGYSVVELKWNHAVPSWFHAAIQDFDLVRTAFSKYAITVLSLRDVFSGDFTSILRPVASFF